MENNLNRLLLRQIKRHFGDIQNMPEELGGFILDISETYKSLEDDARMFQNSLDISSQELRDAYLKQKKDTDNQKDLILKIKRAISTLNPTLVVDDTDENPEMTSLLIESLISLLEEHKRMEITLKESEFYLREILDSQEVGILIIDAETFMISFINQKGASLYGATKEEIIGKVCHEFICPTPCGDCKLSYSQSNQTSIEKILLNVKGEKIPILKSVVHSTFNNRKSFVESFVDITVRKQAEEEVLRAKEAAQSANIAKSDFLASMSHEIRTPLNGVIGFSDLLMKTELSHTQMQYISTVSQSANSLLDIINDILDFSKIEAGKLELDITRNNLLEISSQVADMIKFQAHQKGLELLLNISPEVPNFVMVDAVRLRQVLVNVLGNAVKFTQKGEIEFKIEYLGLNSIGTSDFRFSIRDTGVGISAKYQNKIFEAFSQEDTSTSRKFGGTGLGLTISNKLLGLMGSKLELTSEPGVGSTFCFDVSFKVAEGDAEASGNLDHINKVLIVDDNEHNRFILKEILAFKNIVSDEAKDGHEALKWIEAGNACDVMLLDYNMPGMDGLETVRQIHEIKRIPLGQLPVILLHSSSDDDIVKAGCNKLKIQHRLVKPIKMQQLYDALSRLNSPEYETKNDGGLTENPAPFIADARAHTIMIVEDNAVNLFLIQTILMDIVPNATLVEARNGKLAVDQFLKVAPDLIIMDVQMPVMNGYEAVRAIRQLETGKRVPVIALTAGIVKGEKEKCIEAGMDDYVTKPVVRDTVLKVVSKWLSSDNEMLQPQILVSEKSGILHFNTLKLKANVGEDEVFLNNLIRLAKLNLIETLPEFEETLASKEIKSIKKIAHKMRGTSLSACFEILSEHLSQLEMLEFYSHEGVAEAAQQIRDEIHYLNEMNVIPQI